MVELEKDANQRVATFSKGMKSKLNFARSLINDPDSPGGPTAVPLSIPDFYM